MTILPPFKDSAFRRYPAPLVRCDRCGRTVELPQGPLADACNMDQYRIYLSSRNASEKEWLDMPPLTPDYVVSEFNEELWSHGDPRPMLREALEPLGFSMDGRFRRTVCKECAEAESLRWQMYALYGECLDGALLMPIVWPWPEDDVPEPMDYQRGAESMESYMRRRTERRALKEQGKDPDRTPRYRLVYEDDRPHFGSRNLRCKPLSDDWKESVGMAEGFGPFRLRSVCFIADMAELKRIPREEWH